MHNVTSEDISKQLLWMIIEQLMTLPAYRLSERHKRTFIDYFCRESIKSISKRCLKESKLRMKYYSYRDKYIRSMYKPPSMWQRLIFTFKSFFNKDKRIGLTTFLIMIVIASAADHDGPYIRVALGLITLLCTAAIIVIGIRLIMWMTHVEGAFSNATMIFKDANSYIDKLVDVNEENLEKKVRNISENIIKDDISSLSYQMEKRDFFAAFSALYFVFLIVYVFGGNSVNIAIAIARILRLEGLSYVKQLNIDDLVIFILFPAAVVFLNIYRFRIYKAKIKSLDNRLLYLKAAFMITSDM